jgi:hypothetical protein
MNRDQANVYLAIILTTVGDMGEQGTPSGPLYAGLMGKMGLDDYTMLVGMCKSASLMTEEGHVLKLTDKGKALVKHVKETTGL